MRIKSIITSATLAAALGLGAYGIYYATAPEYQGGAGITYGKAFAPARAEALDFHVWYPAQNGGRSITVGGNGVFFGTKAGRGAPAREGRFPVVVMSHGAGGNAGQFGWIASELAAAGFVTVLPNHPGTTSGNASAAQAVRVWERPKDITATLDALSADPEAFPFMDLSRIYAVGFSAGGYTAMALSGGRVDPDRLQHFCDDGKTGMSDCAFLERGGIDLHALDFSPAAQDLRDPRIQAAVIIDPGIINTLTEESLREIDIPMLILNLGTDDTIPRGVNAKDEAAIIPRANYAQIPDALHFSFLAQCKAKGAKILERGGELDPLCADRNGRDRAALHAEFVDRITAYLAAQ